MKLEYVGPRPLISKRGVSFDSNKEDKYIYLVGILQLMRAIDHEYDDQKIHIYTTESRTFTSDEIIKAINQYCSDMETVMIEANHSAEAYVDEKLRRAENSVCFNSEETHVLINNITLMRYYTIQRYVNKCIYYYVVKVFVNQLKHTGITYISLPANKTFLHVFRTIQRTLQQQKSPVASKLTFYNENGNFSVKLSMGSF